MSLLTVMSAMGVGIRSSKSRPAGMYMAAMSKNMEDESAPLFLGPGPADGAGELHRIMSEEMASEDALLARVELVAEEQIPVEKVYCLLMMIMLSYSLLPKILQHRTPFPPLFLLNHALVQFFSCFSLCVSCVL